MGFRPQRRYTVGREPNDVGGGGGGVAEAAAEWRRGCAFKDRLSVTSQVSGSVCGLSTASRKKTTHTFKKTGA